MIYTVAHKKVLFVPPKSKGYELIQVGGAFAKDRFSENTDDTGVNISEKNGSFCELTGLYWIWKNQQLTADSIVGLVHYRRYFVNHIWWRIDRKIPLANRLLTIDKAKRILKSYDAILPQTYLVEQNSVREQYIQWHYEKDLECVREIIKEQYPDYSKAFDSFMAENQLHPYNMFIMSGDKLNEYCEWLFAILFEAEKRIDISNYNIQQKRVFGFLAERLLNVYIKKNDFKVKEYQVYFKEDE